MSKFKVLIFGASYGSLLATKLAMAGHDVTLICLPGEAQLINSEGTIVRMPLRGGDGTQQVEIPSTSLRGKIRAATPGEVDPSDFDLVGLAMQEPQYGAPEVRALLEETAASRVPCMSIMNMPPLAFIKRIPGVDAAKLRHCYTAPDIWDGFDTSVFTLCSPDPQAFRPPDRQSNFLQVTLPTNFKAAAFENDDANAILASIQADVEAIRYPFGSGEVELPVKLKLHRSIFVPLAKWAMLLTGNYRCVQAAAPISIRDAVHADLAASEKIYDWVKHLCVTLGASEKDDLVPFEKYARAAEGLKAPSSAARALFAGAKNIERVDLLVQSIAAQIGMRNDVLDATVALVNARLEGNRKMAA